MSSTVSSVQKAEAQKVTHCGIQCPWDSLQVFGVIFFVVDQLSFPLFVLTVVRIFLFIPFLIIYTVSNVLTVVLWLFLELYDAGDKGTSYRVAYDPNLDNQLYCIYCSCYV